MVMCVLMPNAPVQENVWQPPFSATPRLGTLGRPLSGSVVGVGPCCVSCRPLSRPWPGAEALHPATFLSLRELR